MREILFRGKRVHSKGEWVYGSLFQTEHCISIWSEEIKDDVEVYPETVGQHTGLKDINENKVFEGDIVMFDTQMWSPPNNEKLVGVVKYGLAHIDASDPYEWAEYYGFYVSCKSNSTGEGSYFEEPITPNVEFEVIGNIFDNPELWDE